MAIASPKTYAFTLVLSGVDVITVEMGDALFEAGCDDSSPSSSEGVVTIHFHREASSLSEAVASAIANVEQAGFVVARVVMDVPQSRWVRCAGRIEVLQEGSRAFMLTLDDGNVIAGVCRDLDRNTFALLSGQMAVVSGLAIFDSSGAVARLEADRATQARGSDLALWSEVPRPLGGELDRQSLHRAQKPGEGIAAVFGRWPGDETDAEIDTLLEQIS